MENDREATGKAGTRNEGRDIDGTEVIALPRLPDRVVENIMLSRSH